MKPSLIILSGYFLILPVQWQDNDTVLTNSPIAHPLSTTGLNKDSSNSIRIINASSLKRLPFVIRDLSAAFNGSIFQDGFLLSKGGFAVYLYDVTCNSFEHAAAVTSYNRDTIYHLKLNRFNQRASDKALASTLIHEIMHCVLLDIYKRAQHGELKARNSVLNFQLNKNDTTSFFNNDFFFMMNSGSRGQHELIQQLLYPHMVSVLQRFELIHTGESLPRREAEQLMWSGLQATIAYTKLSDEEKRTIESSILKAKGIDVDHE